MDHSTRLEETVSGPSARGLILAVLDKPQSNPQVAEQVILAAARLGVDPLDYCAHSLRLGDATVMRRAAHWARFAFSEVIPKQPNPFPIRRLDHLAEIRTMRGVVFDRNVTFCAPGLRELLRLTAASLENPAIQRHLCIVTARTLRAHLADRCTEELVTEARQRLTRQWPNASANVDLPKSIRLAFVALFLLSTTTVAIAPFFFSGWLLPVVAVLFLVPAALRLAAIAVPAPSPQHIDLLSDGELPIYTVLIPLRDEASMVPMLQRGMMALDYPPEKLDIKFVVEQKSAATIEAVQGLLGDPRFELVLIPDAAPHTKPKALNYALPLARGEHLVVYDAEDIPDRRQLRLAASTFAAESGIDCIQAELVIDNAEENWITALFAAEYAGQFGIMLPFLGHWRLPMPLGGTSNHFRTAALRELGHWDAYNVTEDADLGVRLSRLRYRTAMLPSETSEEAPISVAAWMVQRTRWIKGWMQTFIVHNRKAREFLGDIGWRNFLFFQIYVGSLIVSSLLHTVFVIGLIVRGVSGHWPQLSNAVDAAYLSILVLGYAATVAVVVGGLVRRRRWDLMPQQLFLPLYWMMHSLASLRAAWQLLTRPYFWGKTTHGRTKRVRRFASSGDSATG